MNSLSQSPQTRDRGDSVYVSGLVVHGKHGVFEHEKREGHDFVVDVVARLDTRLAGTNDDLEASVSYADLADIAQEVIESPSVDLVETLAERIAQNTFARLPLVRALEVAIHKPSAPLTQRFESVGVRIRRTAPAVTAYAALGSNLGDRAGYLREALAALEAVEGCRVLCVSDIFETEPVSDVEQDRYLNAVCEIETHLGPWELLEQLHAIEAGARRERTVRWGPRTLDLDIVSYGSVRLSGSALTLPHPRAHERAFVLAPLLDVAPEFAFPDHGAAKDLLLTASDREGLTRIGPLESLDGPEEVEAP